MAPTGTGRTVIQPAEQAFETPPAPSTTLAPLVWPVFLTLGAVFVVAQVMGGALFVGFLASKVMEGGGAMPEARLLSAWIEEVLASPTVFVATSLASEGLYLAASLTAAGIGTETYEKRLRTRSGRVGGLDLAAMLIGTLCVGEALDACAALLGLRSRMLKYMLAAVRHSTQGQFVAVIAVGGLLAPVAEEVLFRGFVQTRLTQRWGRWPSIVVTAALFGLAHMDPVHSPIAFAIGFFLGWIVEVSGTIRTSCVAHAANNILSFCMMRVFTERWSSTAQWAALGACLLLLFLSVTWLRWSYARPPA